MNREQFFNKNGNCFINGMLVLYMFCNIQNMYSNKPGSTNDKIMFNKNWIQSTLDIIVLDGFYAI